jgi:hypothetical protein
MPALDWKLALTRHDSSRSSADCQEPSYKMGDPARI